MKLRCLGRESVNHIIIEGGHRLSGTVHISGAKNAVLPLIAAALLPDGGNALADRRLLYV